MRKTMLLTLLLLVQVVSAHAQAPAPAAQPSAARPQMAAPALRGKLVLEKLHSSALEGNLLGDSPERSFYVYLPPSYAAGSRRYPVLYFLHGYTGDYRAGQLLAPVVDKVFAAGGAREMIVVMPDGSNRFDGAFYADSVVTGNWEQHLTRELVSYIDGKYRTLPAAASRGLFGHSMGGNGALRLAMKHPETYGAVYGMSACCMIWADDFSLSNPAWNRTLAMQKLDDFRPSPFLSRAFMALAAAWSPNPERGPFFADFPAQLVDGKLAEVPQVEARWSSEMPVALVDQYRDNLRRLRGVALDVGRQDEFPHIITGARLFSAALARNRVQHLYEEYEGNHGNRLAERIATRVLPFMSEKLQFAAGK